VIGDDEMEKDNIYFDENGFTSEGAKRYGFQKDNSFGFKKGYVPWNKGKKTGLSPMLGKEGKRKTKKEIEDLVNSLGFVLLNYYKEKGQVLVIIQDKSGYKYDVNIQNLKKAGVSIVGKSNPFTLENISLWLKLNSKSFELCENNIYEYSHIKICCSCLNCHEFFNTSWNMILAGHACPRCNESRGEKQISKFLMDNNFEYIHQYRFKDCKYKKPLPFDFYIPKNIICIEFHGKQHYEPVEFFGGEKSFQKGAKLDKIKTDYCKNNNIPLLIIPYWDFDNIDTILETCLFKEQDA